MWTINPQVFSNFLLFQLHILIIPTLFLLIAFNYEQKLDRRVIVCYRFVALTFKSCCDNLIISREAHTQSTCVQNEMRKVHTLHTQYEMREMKGAKN